MCEDYKYPIKYGTETLSSDTESTEAYTDLSGFSMCPAQDSEGSFWVTGSHTDDTFGVQMHMAYFDMSADIPAVTLHHDWVIAHNNAPMDDDFNVLTFCSSLDSEYFVTGYNSPGNGVRDMQHLIFNNGGDINIKVIDINGDPYTGFIPGSSDFMGKASVYSQGRVFVGFSSRERQGRRQVYSGYPAILVFTTSGALFRAKRVYSIESSQFDYYTFSSFMHDETSD
jgi:hypothetical protein